ncbi:beta-galactosidase [Rhizobium skierniewicense]|uniref:beta-galactosidase n=1 Tax=Rhizobium skierniewicense TaxID=984260 RepID=UPI0015723023|nr:beta-galactosidase [Rhizobium skierniewicense]NTF30471.1 beta-galactosidase [Rhizobium skierniewicense]
MLGVCYYPEHWPEDIWAEDARRMAETGIGVVRIAEFGWARMELAPGVFDWSWLDRAIETLAAAGLKLVLGTPTAAPPRWLVDLHPDILPVDRNGLPRLFGSRRHYTPASPAFIEATRRIVTAMMERYGEHPAIIGWQVDNEFGCDDTIFSWGNLDRAHFQDWLKARYTTIDALNAAWGNDFWSMTVGDFAEVELPTRQVCDTNPSSQIDFMRCRSDLFVDYFRLQAEIIRAHAPGRFVTHNFMGFSHTFDHFEMGRQMDVASWDSYPLGRIESLPLTDAERNRFARTGHPDVSALQHDLYRAVGNGRFWIMEQQPGPVNWANWNAVPERGMVRLWTWEALAHGAEAVVYFRWRQYRKAQEQMHAGLLRPDHILSQGGAEASRVAKEIAYLGPLPATTQAPVALVFDYQAAWVTQFQPQGKDFDYRILKLRWYEAFRRLGIDVDVVEPGTSLSGYSLVLVPTLPIVSEAALQAFQETDALILFGPRTGSKDQNFAIPESLPPGPTLQGIMPLKVTEVESMRPGLSAAVSGTVSGTVTRWRDFLETDLEVLAHFDDGATALTAAGRFHYLAGWPETDLLGSVARYLLEKAGLPVVDLPEHVRMRRRGSLTFAFNYGPECYTLPVAAEQLLIGTPELKPHDVACWRA